MAKEIRDPELWKLAERRAGFKYHVLIYFIINIIFWTMWYISLKNTGRPTATINSIPWPVWPMVGWGIIVIIHYMAVYKTNNLQRKEYDKLRNKQK